MKAAQQVLNLLQRQREGWLNEVTFNPEGVKNLAPDEFSGPNQIRRLRSPMSCRKRTPKKQSLSSVGDDVIDHDATKPNLVYNFRKKNLIISLQTFGQPSQIISYNPFRTAII